MSGRTRYGLKQNFALFMMTGRARLESHVVVRPSPRWAGQAPASLQKRTPRIGSSGRRRALLAAMREEGASPWELQLALGELRRGRLLGSPVEYTIVIGCLGRALMWPEAIALLSEARDTLRGDDGVDAVMYSAAIGACEKSTQWDSALLLLAAPVLRAARCNGARAALTLAIGACGRAQRWELALAALSFHPNLKLDAQCYNAVISACERGGRWDMAVGVLLDMRAASVDHTLVTYSAAAKACEQSSHWELALSLLSYARGSGLSLDVVACSTAVSACGHGQKWAQALALLSRMRLEGPRPNIIICNAVISACEKSSEWTRALQLLHCALPKDKLLADVTSFNAAISACGWGGAWLQALGLLASMQALDLKPDRISYSGILSAFANASLSGMALEICRTTARLGAVDITMTLNTAIGTPPKLPTRPAPPRGSPPAAPQRRPWTLSRLPPTTPRRKEEATVESGTGDRRQLRALVTSSSPLSIPAVLICTHAAFISTSLYSNLNFTHLYPHWNLCKHSAMNAMSCRLSLSVTCLLPAAIAIALRGSRLVDTAWHQSHWNVDIVVLCELSLTHKRSC